MTAIEEELKKLNQLTFDAESRPTEGINSQNWKTFLQETLAANFSIRRANGAVQNKAEMLEFIEDSPSDKREVEEGSVTFPVQPGDEAFGVVTSVITLTSNKGKENNPRYRNVKVFSRRITPTGATGPWRCVFWQVAELPKEDRKVETTPPAS